MILNNNYSLTTLVVDLITIRSCFFIMLIEVHEKKILRETSRFSGLHVYVDLMSK